MNSIKYLLIIILFFSLNLFAANTMKYGAMLIHVDGNKVAIELTKSKTIYDGSKSLFTFVDVKAKTYVEFTKSDIENLDKKKKESQNNINSTLDKLKGDPAFNEVRKKAEKQNATSSKDKSPITFTEVQKEVQVQDFMNCTQYSGKRDGKVVQDIWTTAYEDVGLNLNELKTLRELSVTLDKVNDQNKPNISFANMGDGYEGFPVRFIFHNPDGTKVGTELEAFEKKNLDSSIFKVPSGYKKN